MCTGNWILARLHEEEQAPGYSWNGSTGRYDLEKRAEKEEYGNVNKKLDLWCIALPIHQIL